MSRFDAAYTNYLRYNGFVKLHSFVTGLTEHVRTGDRQDAIVAISAFIQYINQLCAWSFHYFPWGLGNQLAYESPAEMATSPTDLSRRVHITSGPKIKLTWMPLGINVYAILAIKENPELCADIMGALPFQVLQVHAVVSGESIYAWVPAVSTAKVRIKERQCDAPPGRIRFSQRTGHKIVIQYGEVTEDLETPVLGEILEQYRNQLAEVGRRVLQSTFETKEVIMLNVELA